MGTEPGGNWLAGARGFVDVVRMEPVARIQFPVVNMVASLKTLENLTLQLGRQLYWVLQGGLD